MSLFSAFKQRIKDRLTNAKPPPTWAGVYDSPADVASIDGGFSNEVLLDPAVMAFNQEKLSGAGKISGGMIEFLFSILLSRTDSSDCKGAKIKVFDFGGALGNHLLRLDKANGSAVNVDWTVTELAPVCAKGREIWAGDGRIHFFESLPSSSSYECDVVIAGSSLQYSDNFRSTLEAFMSYKPDFIFLVNTPIGDIDRSFVAKQVNIGPIFAWMMSLKEIREIAIRNNYHVVFSGNSPRKHNADAFPEGLRIEFASDVLLAKGVAP